MSNLIFNDWDFSKAEVREEVGRAYPVEHAIGKEVHRIIGWHEGEGAKYGSRLRVSINEYRGELEISVGDGKHIYKTYSEGGLKGYDMQYHGSFDNAVAYIAKYPIVAFWDWRSRGAWVKLNDADEIEVITHDGVPCTDEDVQPALDGSPL